MATNKSATEQLDELKAAALLSVWRERLLGIDKQAKRIAELEEENRELHEDMKKIRQQCNQYQKDLQIVEEKLVKADKQITYICNGRSILQEKYDKAQEELERLYEAYSYQQCLINEAPKNIRNYFNKRTK